MRLNVISYCTSRTICMDCTRHSLTYLINIQKTTLQGRVDVFQHYSLINTYFRGHYLNWSEKNIHQTIVFTKNNMYPMISNTTNMYIRLSLWYDDDEHFTHSILPCCLVLIHWTTGVPLHPPVSKQQQCAVFILCIKGYNHQCHGFSKGKMCA